MVIFISSPPRPAFLQSALPPASFRARLFILMATTQPSAPRISPEKNCTRNCSRLPGPSAPPLPPRRPPLLPSRQKQSREAEVSVRPSQASRAPDRRLTQLQRPRAACTSDGQERRAKYAPHPSSPTPRCCVLTGEDKWDFISCSAARRIKFTGGLFPAPPVFKSPASIFVSRHRPLVWGNNVSLPLRVLSSCRVLSSFIVGLFNLYEDLFFTYLEINPLGKWIIITNPDR